jgi:hypothetical protein
MYFILYFIFSSGGFYLTHFIFALFLELVYTQSITFFVIYQHRVVISFIGSHIDTFWKSYRALFRFP